MYRLRNRCVMSPARRRSRRVVLVDRDVEASLTEFFLYIDNSGCLIGEEMIAHPLHFAARQTRLRNIDGGSGEVRADDVTFGVCCVVIHSHKPLLVLDCTHSRTDDKWLMELRFVCAGEIAKKISGPLTTVPALVRKARIDNESRCLGHADQRTTGDAILQIDVVLNPLE